MTHLTQYLNEMNKKLQGNAQTVRADWARRNKLNVLQSCLAKYDLAHFQCCQRILDKKKRGDFLTFVRMLKW